MGSPPPTRFYLVGQLTRSLHAPAGDDNEVHFVVHMDVLDVEACSGKVVVPAYKNRTPHGYLIIIVSHVTKFHGF